MNTNFSSLSRLFCIFSTIVLLSGCSPDQDSSTSTSPPTSSPAPSKSLDGMAEALLRGQIEDQSHGRMKLISFNKIDGQTDNVFGVDRHAINFEATIQFTVAGTWLPGSTYAPFLDYEFVPSPEVAHPEWGHSALNAHMNNTVVIKGMIEGRKMDDGWKFEVSKSYIKPGQVQ